MVHMKTMTFDEQAQALLERGIVDDETTFRTLLETARPAEPVERSVLTMSRDVVPSQSRPRTSNAVGARSSSAR